MPWDSAESQSEKEKRALFTQPCDGMLGAASLRTSRAGFLTEAGSR